jgi:pseudouridine kinase
MQPDGHVLVIGAAGIDHKGQSHHAIQLGTSNPGRIGVGFGGVGRNIAENLARLEIDVMFMTALSDDADGHAIRQHCEAAGVQMDPTLTVPAGQTGTYLSIAGADGEMLVALSDYRVLASLTPAHLDEHEATFAEARLLVIDLNLSTNVLAYTVGLAHKHQLPIVVDPTSPAHSPKLCDYLDRLYLVAPNAAETTELCGLDVPTQDTDAALKAAQQLVALGVDIAIVTLGEQGLAYSDGQVQGIMPAVHTTVKDTTGAGDALIAAVIFGLGNDIPLEDAMRLGVTAAALTLHSEESVCPTLTPDDLYNTLVV